MSLIELAPVVKSIDVRRSAVDAFRIFTEEITAWWPMKTHSRARDAAGELTVRVTVEPRVGGRVYETLNDGRELDWGNVTVYEPGALLALEWRMGRPAEQFTDISVRFEPLTEQTCRVTLTHENWERMGEDAPKLREGYNNGWVTVFEKGFGGLAGLA
jgi:hypothetical protein